MGEQLADSATSSRPAREREPVSTEDLLDSARRRLREASGKPLSEPELARRASALADELFELSRRRLTAAERAREGRIAQLLDDPRGQLFGVLLTDRVAHDQSRRHVTDQLAYLLETLGAPAYATAFERLLMRAAVALGPLAPRWVGGQVAAHVRREVEGLVFPFEGEALSRYLADRARAGVRVNLNHLGEEVLGESAAEQRLEAYVELLGRPDVSTISVKLSSIYSQLELSAWDASARELSARLREIYRAALRAGTGAGKLVYLDMESYADLHLTLEVMQGLLSEDEFAALTAGVVLQAYVPESAALQRRLAEFASRRVERGGAPLRMRIVKGANLAAERVHASHSGWALPLFGSKAEVDAAYAKMLHFGTRPEVARALELGVASHNAFDLALGLVLRAARGVENHVGFEVLEGMASGTLRVLSELGAPVLVYAPVVSPREFSSAVAYLMRRLDENTSSENFLRHAFAMQVSDPRYEARRAEFLDAHAQRDRVSELPRRPQNRFESVRDPELHQAFESELDTDFSSRDNRAVVDAALREMHERRRGEIASIVQGRLLADGRSLEDGFDPSRPGVVPYRYRLATDSDVRAAVEGARDAARAFREQPLGERCRLVVAVARVLRRRRAELIAAMVMDAGKRVVEADAEVSEAVDFAEYYARRALDWGALEEARGEPLGVVVVLSPWNFPLAIPLSGILAALCGGNAVLFKPALETAFVGHLLAECVHQAGVPASAFSLILARERDASALVESRSVDALVLTGATTTARSFVERRPDLRLFAETGGKNAFVISARADVDRAVGDLVKSAFGHAGQKCSAASVAIVEAGVHDDPAFRRKLRDAAASAKVGSAWDPASRVTPLIREPGPTLMRGLTRLDAGESWLLRPRESRDNPRLWSPGIRLGVQPGSFCQRTELFGPVLSVVRARDFEHAIQIANDTEYGLVAGLSSLDEREHARFVEAVECGNLYVNRPITGAIVGRQPFGGQKASSVGPGAKAGGPNYVAQLQRFAGVAPRERGPAAALAASPRLSRFVQLAAPLLDDRGRRWLELAVDGFLRAGAEHFSRAHDPWRLRGQDNLFVYRPCRAVLVYAGGGAKLVEALACCAAGLVAGVGLRLASAAPFEGAQRRGLSRLAAELGFAVELTPPSPARLSELNPQRLRWLGDRDQNLLAMARRGGVDVCFQEVTPCGRLELCFYFQEQSVSIDYHRHGHLGFRSLGESYSPGFTTNSKATFSPSGPAGRGP